MTVPGEIDPDTLPARPREEIIGMMSASLRAEYPRLEAAIDRDERTSLASKHDLGRRVHRLQTDEARYGSGAVALVAAAAGVDPSVLYRAARLVEVYPRRRDIERLMARRGDGGYRFTWSHVLQLLTIDEASRRAEFIEVAFRDRLTVRELARLTVATHDNRAGRPLRTVLLPRSLSGGLERLELMTSKLRDQVRVLVPETVLPQLANVPSEHLTEDVLVKVARVRDELTGLASEASAAADDIARAEADLARRRVEVPSQEDQQSRPVARAPGTAGRPKATSRRDRRPVEA